MKKKLKRVYLYCSSYYVPLKLSFIVFVILCPLSIGVSKSHLLEKNPLFSYIIYISSAFSLVLVIQSFLASSIRQKIVKRSRQLTDNYPLFHRMCYDFSYRTMIATRISAVTNSIASISKVCTGLIFSSFWLIIVSMYYVLLVVTKFLLIHSGQKESNLTHSVGILKREWTTYGQCGKLVLVLSVTFQFLIVGTLHFSTNSGIGDNIIYLMAMYDFYCIFSTGYHVFFKQKNHIPLTKAVKSIAFISSLFSLLSLQNAMSTLSISQGKETFFLRIKIISGTIICLFVFFFGLWMIYRSYKELIVLEAKDDTNISC